MVILISFPRGRKTIKYSQMQGNPRNTDDSRCSGTKRLYTSWFLVFWHEERERQFLPCWLLLNRPSVNHVLDCSAPSQIWTNVFSKSPKISAHRFRAWRHSHPSPISYMGFLLWHLWLSYPLRASVNCTQCVCTCTFTKPNSSKPNQTEWWNIINEKW